MVSGAEDRAEGHRDTHERPVWSPNSVVAVGGDLWVRVRFRVDDVRVRRRSTGARDGSLRAGPRPGRPDSGCVSNERFAAFVGSTGYVTDAERAGYSFVVIGHLTNELRPGRTAFGTEWWREVPGADWRHPAGPGSTVVDRLAEPVVHVSRRDALAFCAWAGRRLPTGEEWELASGVRSTGPAAFVHGYWLRATDPDLGLGRPGAGLWEWVATPPDGTPGTRRRPGPGGLRGGSCGCDTPDRCPYRLAARMGVPADCASSTISFRCAG